MPRPMCLEDSKQSISALDSLQITLSEAEAHCTMPKLLALMCQLAVRPTEHFQRINGLLKPIGWRFTCFKLPRHLNE